MGSQDDQLAILRVLDGITRGINQGLERRRENKMEADKLQLQSEELALRHQEREVSAENNRIYREQYLAQRGVDTQVRKELGQGELKIKGSKEAGDQHREIEQTISGIEEKRRKIQDQRRKLEKGLAGLGDPVEGESPRKKARRDYFAQEIQAIADEDSALQKQIESANARRPGAKKQSALPPGDSEEVMKLEQLINSADFDTAKTAADQAMKSGAIKPGTPAFDRVIKSLRQKQFNAMGNRRGN